MKKKVEAAGILLFCVKENKFLTGIRNEPQKRVDLFGGGKENGESFLKCAQREFYEETDIYIKSENMIELYVFETPYIKYITFLGLVFEKPEVVLNDEHEGFFWDDIGGLLSRGNLHKSFAFVLGDKENYLKKLVEKSKKITSK